MLFDRGSERRMFISSAVAFAKAATTNATVSASKKAAANSKVQSFRQIVNSRVSARRFEPNVPVPDHVWLDILKMTMVSSSSVSFR